MPVIGQLSGAEFRLGFGWIDRAGNNAVRKVSGDDRVTAVPHAEGDVDSAITTTGRKKNGSALTGLQPFSTKSNGSVLFCCEDRISCAEPLRNGKDHVGSIDGHGRISGR